MLRTVLIIIRGKLLFLITAQHWIKPLSRTILKASILIRPLEKPLEIE